MGTHPRFMEYTKGLDPSVGHWLLSANFVTFHMSSYLVRSD